MAFEIEIEGLDKLQEAFEKSPEIVRKELEKTTKNAGMKIQKTEVAEAPHKTGNLQRSIKWTYVPIVSKIVPMADYALPVHEGSKPHTILPVRARALYWKGAPHPVMRVMHPGTKGNPFVARTVQKVEKEVQRLFDDALKNVINELSK
jgi:HK97 gp10 family phage protein